MHEYSRHVTVSFFGSTYPFHASVISRNHKSHIHCLSYVQALMADFEHLNLDKRSIDYDEVWLNSQK